MTVQSTEGTPPPPPLRFTLRIVHFSSRGGALASDVFRGSEQGTGWSLSVQPREESGAILFQLHRWGPFRLRSQSVRIKLTVLDLLSSRLLSTGKRIHFSGEEGESRIVMRLPCDQFEGWCGLKGLCFLPNDTLAVRCEIDESEEDTKPGEVTPSQCVWRHSYLLSIHATGLPLA